MPKSRQRKSSGRRRSSRRRGAVAAGGADQAMSAVILEFIEPYHDEDMEEGALENLVALAIVAWNVAILPTDKQEASLDDFCAKLFRRTWLGRLIDVGRWLRKLIGRPRAASSPEVESPEVTEFKRMARELMQRKQRYYPHNHRFILDYRLTMTEDGPHLTVVSTLPRI